MNFLYLVETQRGKDRRNAIKAWFLANPDGVLFVNLRGRPQMKQDRDLQRLVKEQFLIQRRMSRGGNCKVTFLERAK